MKIVRFLHASDFQLHEPLVCFGSGTFSGALYPDMPEELRGVLETAAWESAERCFDAALENKVDFLLLTGNLLAAERTGPRGIVFLTQQFQRLNEAGIPIYWKLTEPLSAWSLPDSTFPENVYLFPPGETKIRKFKPADDSRTLFLLSWDGAEPDWTRYDLSKLPGEKLPPRQTIALRHEESGNFPAVYVARGMAEKRLTRTYTAAFIDCEEHTPGLIQGRSPEVLDTADGTGEWGSGRNSNSWDAGGSSPSSVASTVAAGGVSVEDLRPTFGASLVKLDLDGVALPSIQFLPLETVAWRGLFRTVPNSVQDLASLETWLESQFFEQCRTLETSPHVKRTLLYWKLHSEQPAIQRILRQIFRENLEPEVVAEASVSSRLLEKLRNDTVWSVSLETDDALLPQDWAQSDSIPGDFLRLVRFHQNNPQSPHAPGFASYSLKLDAFLSDLQKNDDIAVLAQLKDPAQVLRDAEILGADLLDENQASDRN